ncbi:MAG: ROK family protein [Bacteroidota bacterium]
MNQHIIAADIGGSHISSTVIHTKNWQIDPTQITETKVNAFADKESIILGWVQNLQQTARTNNITDNYQIAIALPGPFDYQKGIFQAHPKGKMSSLVGEDFRSLLLPHFGDNLKIAFANDAACFGLGAACFGKGKPYDRIIGITLGTGIGSSFIGHQKIISKGHGVPVGGEVYALPFLQGIADDYFSTRWFVAETKRALGKTVTGVRELVETMPPDDVNPIFTKFSHQFYQFLRPYATNFKAEAIIIGGNIAKAWPCFSTALINFFAQDNITVLPSTLNEKAIILGAAKVFADKENTTTTNNSYDL